MQVVFTQMRMPRPTQGCRTAAAANDDDDDDNDDDNDSHKYTMQQELIPKH
jgi:hypothetical protein